MFVPEEQLVGRTLVKMINVPEERLVPAYAL